MRRNQYLAVINPKMHTVQSAFQQSATVANIFGDAAEDLVTVVDSAPPISNTINGAFAERDDF